MKSLFALENKLKKASGNKEKKLITYWVYTHESDREKLNKAAEECQDALEVLQGKLIQREMNKAALKAEEMLTDVQRFTHQ